MELYKRIRIRREELGMSQQDLAKRLGYKSRSSINKIELGENDIPQSKIAAFATALETSEAWLMGYEEKQPYQEKIDKVYAFDCQLKVLGWSYKIMVEGNPKTNTHPSTYALFQKGGLSFKVSANDYDSLINDSLSFLNDKLQELFKKNSKELFSRNHYYVDAANPIENASAEDKEYDEDIMNDDNF